MSGRPEGLHYVSQAPAAALSGDARRGKTLFEGEGGCRSCHRVDGKGSRVALDLNDAGGWTWTAAYIGSEFPTARAAIDAIAQHQESDHG